MNQRISSVGVDVLRFLLNVLGLLVLLGGGLAGVLAALAPSTVEGSRLPSVLTGVAMLVGAATVAVLLFSLSTMLRLLTRQVQTAQLTHGSIENLQAAVLLVEKAVREQPAPAALAVSAAPVVAATTAAPAVDEAARSEMLDLLKQLRDTSLMSESQRAAAAAAHWAKRKDFITRLIDRDMAMANWASAFAHLAELQAVAPGDADVAALEAKLKNAQAQRLTDDLAAARTQLRHLMSITAWTQAEEVARGMLAKYPHESEAQALAHDVQRERQAFEKEHLDRMLLDLADATEHRNWRRALQIAEEATARYAGEPRVEKLRRDLPTIKQNAESAERKEQEELFRDLLKRQRYDEAANVAKGVINKYPASATAVELNKLLPKVEELIKQEKLKKQQAGAATEAPRA